MITRAGSFKLFSALGVDVFVHWTWFVAAYIIYQLSGGQNPVSFLAIYGSLFGIVLLHEYGHALACRSVGGRADHIVLWPLGGVAYVAPPPRPGAVLWSIAAGPLVNAVLAPICFLLGLLVVPLMGETTLALALARYFIMMAWINVVLLAFNMLPIYPLDGGQILQSILWFFIGRAKSLRITALFGLIVAGITFLLALTGNSEAIPISRTMLLLLSLFVAWQAWQGFNVARVLAHQEAHEGQSIERALQRARDMAGPPRS